MSRYIAAITAIGLTTGWCLPSAHSQAPAQPLVQMPVRSGVLTLKVADYEGAYRQLAETTKKFGAELKDANTAVNEKGAKHGWVRLVLPREQLAGLLTAARPLGTLYAETVETRDVTSDYAALERRARLLQEHRRSLLGLLSPSRRLRSSDILFVQERLFRAAVDESELRQERVDLARSAQTCSLMVVMFEPAATPAPEGKLVNLRHWFSVGIGRAHIAMNHNLARAVTASAYLAVFSWLWVPIALAVIIVERRTRALARLAQALKRTASAPARRTVSPPSASASAGTSVS